MSERASDPPREPATEAASPFARDLAGLSDADEFWRWSAARYARPGAAAALIALQDRHGVNVNAFLWAVWLGENGAGLSAAAAAAAIDRLQPVSHAITEKVRSARRSVKAVDAAAYEVLKDAELACERLEQRTLCGGPRPGADAPASVGRNVAAIIDASVDHDSPEVLDAGLRVARTLTDAPLGEMDAGKPGGDR